jgi:hypothetical protein
MNGFFLIAHGDSAEIFQLAKQAFNGVNLAYKKSCDLGRNLRQSQQQRQRHKK